MIWGAFFERGTSDLAVICGMQKCIKYNKTLADYLLPFGERAHRNGWIFQQDNASIHRSKVTEAWFTSKNVNVMA